MYRRPPTTATTLQFLGTEMSGQKQQLQKQKEKDKAAVRVSEVMGLT